MNQDMKRKPPYFDKVQEYFLDNETATPPPSREESPETPVIKLPTAAARVRVAGDRERHHRRDSPGFGSVVSRLS